MALFLAVVFGLVAGPLASYLYPNLFSRIHLSKCNTINPQLSAFIDKTLALENITGLSVAVIPKHGEPEFHAWGHRTEDRDEVTPDTLFHVASISKAFCATALGLLIDDFANGNNVTTLPPGVTKLTWKTRLRVLLPDWQLMDKWASERANLRDILSHVSGLPRHDPSYGLSDTPQEMITRLKYLRPAFELRERWSYNNIMYMVAAHVIATYSGRPYTSFVEERIFAPLEMTSSTFSPARAEASGKFTQGWSRGGRRIPECLTEDTAFLMAGPGGIISSVVDMARWISAWIHKGIHNNQAVIPLSVYQNVSYSHFVSTDHPTDPEHSIVGYGLGWFRSSYRGHDIAYHSGSLPGLSTLVSFLPNDEIGVVVFANGEDKAAPLSLISNHILDSALHLTSSLTPARLALVQESSPADVWPSSPPCNVATTEPSPNTQSSTLSLDALAGTYSNPGYGSFTLCAPSSTSRYCANVRSNFTIVGGVQDNRPFEGLLAERPCVWSSHVRMRAKRGSIFDFYFTTLYPNGYGKDATPFETKEIGTTEGLAEFVVEDGKVIGFGLSGLEGQLTERACKYETVRDQAEVWFDKV